jgi:hypothetical protein
MGASHGKVLPQNYLNTLALSDQKVTTEAGSCSERMSCFISLTI